MDSAIQGCIIYIYIYCYCFIIGRDGEIREGWRGHQWMRRKIECGGVYYSQL